MGTEFKSWALTPPMGWNSWDCFGGAVTEEEIRQNAEYMAEHLASYGWEYIVIDIEWYNSGASRVSCTSRCAIRNGCIRTISSHPRSLSFCN